MPLNSAVLANPVLNNRRSTDLAPLIGAQLSAQTAASLPPSTVTRAEYNVRQGDEGANSNWLIYVLGGLGLFYFATR